MHPLPLQPFTAVFGQTRRVHWDATVAFGGVRYSVPHQLIDARVWVRNQGEEVIVTVETPDGPAEAARHAQGTPGNPQIKAEHYPHPVDAGERLPEATSAEEALFLSLGSGAADWLVEAAAAINSDTTPTPFSVGAGSEVLLASAVRYRPGQVNFVQVLAPSRF